jgi:hypothetical protein
MTVHIGVLMSPSTSPKPTIDHWPEAARIIKEVGERLQAQYGKNDIPAKAIKREAERVGRYKTDSVLPSDYCYNIINRASFSFKYPVFSHVGRGRYMYVGPNYAYTGPIFWTPKGEAERQVGSWQSGEYTLDDPRK